MTFPVIVKSVNCAGGTCPYQIEGATEDGQMFYLRYRNGWLRAGCGHERDMCAPGFYNIVSVKAGDDLDGSAYFETLNPFIEGKIIFPEGFKIGDSAWLMEEDES